MRGTAARPMDPAEPEQIVAVQIVDSSKPMVPENRLQSDADRDEEEFAGNIRRRAVDPPPAS